jgi:hypothetical protein
VQNFQSTPPYTGANSVNYETFEITFTAMAGDAIRIVGAPGGSARFVSIGELRAYDDRPASIVPDPTIPHGYMLLQNFPNPFNPTTRIAFSLPVAGEVSIKVYNMLGQEIATLAKGYYDAGPHWADFSGGSLANGVYLYYMKAGTFFDVKKMVVLK